MEDVSNVDMTDENILFREASGLVQLPSLFSPAMIHLQKQIFGVDTSQHGSKHRL